MRGNRNLGVLEIAELLEELVPQVERIVREDGFVTALEQQTIDILRALVTDCQSLAVRTQIAVSLIRGKESPPERVADLIADYHRHYRKEEPLAAQAA